MQQLLKLGAAGSAALPGLSNSFLVWDMDMIALRPPSFITARWRAGSTGVAVTLLHAGGNAVGSYDAAVLSLAGVPSARAADGSSLVANAMLFRTEVVKELREAMGGEQDAAWAWAALAAAVRAPDPKLGFSEYQTYASWLLARRPQEAQIVGGRCDGAARCWHFCCIAHLLHPLLHPLLRSSYFSILSTHPHSLLWFFCLSWMHKVLAAGFVCLHLKAQGHISPTTEMQA